ncbi:CAP domain-containing protein [Streptomyces sp. ST2-7A]|uniref:CAP domain-containing protein n=1 Tax=Streptomyces sp. ST2-7A TaxID=2907214 RepID=UPI001F180F85|nr:CAP domain-containing protein [Streptomyces sp. ST2-7A]MCE7079933.1 CAP domain-containing protein [Streptomyces sp. ST2-7A]
MGRHRRSVPGRGTHRKQAPARAGLLGVSAALTVGAVAAGAGVLPGAAERFTLDDLHTFQAGGDRSGAVSGSPSIQGGRGGESIDRGEERPSLPSASPSETAEEKENREREEAEEEIEEPEETEEPEDTPEPEPTPEATTPSATPDPEPGTTAPAPSTSAPESSRTTSPPGQQPSTGTPSGSEDPAETAEAEVLRLVNVERARAGCSPVVQDTALGRLARDFSRDMANRSFFSHTDPDGRSPWDRASTAGIGNLGGENIARGQQSAASVMESWMNSEGHRANILNCDFRTLGVGVHLGPGGPWWTQNFGY